MSLSRAPVVATVVFMLLDEFRKEVLVGNVLIGAGIGLAAGVLSGLFGIGGGIIIVPALVFVGLSQKHATGTSLAALLLPVGILGVLEYAHRHEVDFRYAVGIAVGLTVGVFFGALWAGSLSNIVLRRAFGGIMLVASLRLLIFKP
ncbi:MAG: TSUP family transporter [Actinomycetota bacterium]